MVKHVRLLEQQIQDIHEQHVKNTQVSVLPDINNRFLVLVFPCSVFSILCFLAITVITLVKKLKMLLFILLLKWHFFCHPPALFFLRFYFPVQNSCFEYNVPHNKDPYFDVFVWQAWVVIRDHLWKCGWQYNQCWMFKFVVTPIWYGLYAYFDILQAEESEIEEKLKELQCEVDATASSLARFWKFSFYQFAFFILPCFQGRFYSLPVKSTIFQFEGRRECLIRKPKRGIKWNSKNC